MICTPNPSLSGSSPKRPWKHVCVWNCPGSKAAGQAAIVPFHSSCSEPVVEISYKIICGLTLRQTLKKLFLKYTEQCYRAVQ